MGDDFIGISQDGHIVVVNHEDGTTIKYADSDDTVCVEKESDVRSQQEEESDESVNWTKQVAEKIEGNLVDSFPDSWEIEGFTVQTNSFSALRPDSLRATVRFLTKGVRVEVKVHSQKSKEVTIDVRDRETEQCRVIYKRKYEDYDSLCERLVNQITCCRYILDNS